MEVADKEVKDPIAWRQAEIQYPSLMVSGQWGCTFICCMLTKL